MSIKKNINTKISAAMVLVAVGIVYGDIATSPMYVMKSIISGNGGITNIDKDFIIGSLSLIIWTITLITTVKYVLIAMKADNKGEGGIFALYSLVKKNAKWLIIPAIIGGSALLADGMLTPAVTVTTAVEGLTSINWIENFFNGNQWIIVGIVLGILVFLFLGQRSGTSAIGKVFGPFMIVWFLFLSLVGLIYLAYDPEVLKAFNPVYGIRILFSDNNIMGLTILGSVFLATTGAEALYADMGHVGKKSIYVSWPFVKIALILNYLGQSVWIIDNIGNESLMQLYDLNPFYEMLPGGLKLIGIALATCAAIIASQALITGSFTVVSEAIRLDLLPHMKTSYPSEQHGQIYIKLVNIILWLGCSFVVVFFRTSANMESAYGLSIIITLISVTFLLTSYIYKNKNHKILGILFGIFYLYIECNFFIASLEKFVRGGIFALFIAILIIFVMIIWLIGTRVENKELQSLKITDYIPKLKKLKDDKNVELTANNLVYLDHQRRKDYIDIDIIYSILEGKPKRADAYWFIDFRVLETPYGGNYTVRSFGTNFVFKVIIRLGFKEEQRLDMHLYNIVTDLIESGELPEQKQIHTMFEEKKDKKFDNFRIKGVGTTMFCIIRKILLYNTDIPLKEKWAVILKHKIRNACANPKSWYGIEDAQTIIEQVPFFIKYKDLENKLPRVD